MGTNDAGKRVPVGHGYRLMAKSGSGLGQFLWMRRPAQEAEVRGDLKFGVSSHLQAVYTGVIPACAA